MVFLDLKITVIKSSHLHKHTPRASIFVRVMVDMLLRLTADQSRTSLRVKNPASDIDKVCDIMQKRVESYVCLKCAREQLHGIGNFHA